MMSRIMKTMYLVIALAFAQEKVVLFDFEPRGIDEATVRLSTQLLRDALNNTLKYVVVEPTAGPFYTVIPAAEEARKVGASKAIIGSITQLGTTRLINFQLIDAASATVEFGDKVAAPSIEEYPTCFDRVAKAIYEKKTFQATLEPDQVIEPETEPRFKRARQPTASFFLTAGYLYPLKDREDDLYGLRDGLFNMNLAISFETPGLLTLAQMGLMRGMSSETDITFDIQMNRVLTKDDFAPFVGLGIGVTRYTWVDQTTLVENRTDGLNFGANIGLLGFRSYYFRLLAEAGANVTLTNKWGPIPGARIGFGLTTPSFGPGGDIETTQGCVATAIFGFFITGLVVALTQ